MGGGAEFTEENSQNMPREKASGVDSRGSGPFSEIDVRKVETDETAPVATTAKENEVRIADETNEGDLRENTSVADSSEQGTFAETTSTQLKHSN